MSARRVHFPRTTPSQRRLLFETWEATGAVEAACRTAQVGVRTFYYWKRRFAVGAYAALGSFQSPAAHLVHRTPAPVVEQII